MMRKVAKFSVLVVTENRKDLQKYSNLFAFMLEDKITREIEQKGYRLIETHDMRIEFIMKYKAIKGKRVHFVLNLTQDEEFHYNCLEPISYVHRYLEEDPRWSKLFERMERFK